MDEDQKLRAEKAFDRDGEWFNKLNETAIESGTAALKYSFLLNGGACLALLAFLANTLTASGLPSDQRAMLAAITNTLGLFAWGAFLSALASGGAYFVNRCYLEANFRTTKHYDAPHIRYPASANRWLYAGNAFTVATILLIVSSLVLFVIGLVAISRSITA